MQGVLCILGTWNLGTSAVLEVVAIGPQVSPDLLNLTLSLAVGLWVIS